MTDDSGSPAELHAWADKMDALSDLIEAARSSKPIIVEAHAVLVTESLWAPLIRYAIAEGVNLETAVNQFIRDGLESA